MVKLVDLKRGDKGEAVIVLQTMLHGLHYTNKEGKKPLAIDGSFGQNTENAVKQFCKREKVFGADVPVNGTVDSRVWSILVGDL